MNTAVKIAALSPVALGVVGLTQFHYVVSHLSSIAEVGAAIAVGAAIWTGKTINGKRKAKQAEPTVDERVAELAAQLQRSLPQPAQVIDYTAAGQAVSKVTRL